MSILVIVCIMLASVYYRNINNSVDPRISDARTLYEKYNTYTGNNHLDSVFILMDSIESFYAGIAHYKNSYETGVLYNNRAAAYLVQALHLPIAQADTALKDSLLTQAELAAERSIKMYEQWLKKYGKLDESQLRISTRSEFMMGLNEYDNAKKMEFFDARIEELLQAQKENKRRLSVAVTNLGLVHRHKGDIKGAAQCYIRAMELWDRNLDAENNLNLLLGKPLRKRTLIEKLFPPNRD
ncbi:MAG: hypothetical protein GVY19_12680 [Bacteroidetes bacterium]|jgi:tetratricopeptide (TPR) repeat protein|nr:hypothetical protein [Bacteroidota bacterium]